MPRPRSALRLIDVAERAGVSLATASRALAGRDGVSEQVANHVRQAFQEAGGRVAVIGRHFLSVDAVLPDNEPAGRVIAEHVLSLGHRRIAVAAGSERLTTVVDRLAGVASA